MLPQDPIMLMSYLNTKLRDNYSSLQSFAEDNDLSSEELLAITKKLEAAGFTYNADRNQFV